MVHKHVAAFLHSLAVSEGSDEPKPRLVVEPLHAASEPGGTAAAAVAAVYWAAVVYWAAAAAAAVVAVYWAAAAAVYWTAAAVAVVAVAVVALVGCTHCCFRSDKNPRRGFKFVFGISCFIV